MTTLLERATGFQQELAALHRDLDRHRALSSCETRTAALVARRMEFAALLGGRATLDARTGYPAVVSDTRMSDPAVAALEPFAEVESP